MVRPKNTDQTKHRLRIYIDIYVYLTKDLENATTVKSLDSQARGIFGITLFKKSGWQMFLILNWMFFFNFPKHLFIICKMTFYESRAFQYFTILALLCKIKAIVRTCVF